MPSLLQPLLPLLGLIAFLVILTAIIKALKSASKTPKSFPYVREESLFSPAEKEFMAALEQALGNQYRVFGKVRLADVLSVKKGLDRKYRRQIADKTGHQNGQQKLPLTLRSGPVAAQSPAAQ